MKLFQTRWSEILGLAIFSSICWLTLQPAKLWSGSLVVVLFILLLALIYEKNKQLNRQKVLTNGQCWISFILLVVLYAESLIYITVTDLFLLLPIVVLMLPYFIYHYILSVILAED